MDYFKIVKKAFILPWKYRFLFWLGVLASFAAGGGGGWSGFNYSGSSSDLQKIFDQNKQSSFLNKLQGSVPRMSRVLGASTDRFSDFVSHNIYWIALVVLILMLIGIALLIFGTFARAGIVRSILKLEKKEKCEFLPALWEGKKFFWRLVGAGILSFLFFLALIAVLGGISVPLFMLNLVLGFIWLVPAILILIVAVIYIGLVIQFWMQIFIVEDKGIIKTIKPAISLVNSRFKEVIIFWLISMAANLIYTVGTVMVIFIVVLPLALLAIGAGIANLIAGIIIGAIGFLIVYLVMLAISGYYTAGIMSYWTLAYLELRKK